jgi:hypothetical protein
LSSGGAEEVDWDVLAGLEAQAVKTSIITAVKIVKIILIDLKPLIIFSLPQGLSIYFGVTQVTPRTLYGFNA